MKKDIEHIDDIKLLVDAFYTKVQQDDLLKHIFNGVIQDQWAKHLQKMYDFWQTVLLDEHTYYGSPFVPHAQLPVSWTHFEHWLTLFGETVDQYFEGDKANRAKWQAERMAKMFHSKIEYYRNNSSKPLI